MVKTNLSKGKGERDGIETDIENGLMDTEREGEGEMIGRVGLTNIY